MNMLSVGFIAAFFIFTVIYYAVGKKFQQLFLILAGIGFYACSGFWPCVLLIVCTLLSYGAGLIQALLEDKKKAEQAMFVSCVLLLALLWALLREASVRQLLVMPVGMSFYILQMIGYLSDIYKKKGQAEKSLKRYALLILFFPKLSVGPLVKSSKFLEQAKEPAEFSGPLVEKGLLYMLAGFFEKIVLSQTLSPVVGMIYKDFANLNSFYLICGFFLYSLFLYFDFAGYSFIAIGAGYVLGFDLGENFKRPYFAADLQEFWRRWHIGLSGWLRDYIYIPLGGSRRGRLIKMRNQMITFIASGFWHGTGLHYIAWGMLHGAGIIAEDLVPAKTGAFSKAVRRVWMLLFVSLAWPFFQCGSLRDSLRYYVAVANNFRTDAGSPFSVLPISAGLTAAVFIFAAVVFVLEYRLEKGFDLIGNLIKCKTVCRWALCLLTALIIFLFAVRFYGQGQADFVYARF